MSDSIRIAADMALDDWELWLPDPIDERTGKLSERELKYVYG